MKKFAIALAMFVIASPVLGQTNKIELPNFKNHKIYKPYVYGVYNINDSITYIQLGYAEDNFRNESSYEFSIYAGPIATQSAMDLYNYRHPFVANKFVDYVERNARLAVYIDKKSNRAYLYKRSRDWYRLGFLRWKLVEVLEADYQKIHKELKKLFKT